MQQPKPYIFMFWKTHGRKPNKQELTQFKMEVERNAQK